tara:strand:+ start:46 stop:477 length:432 start_codon:yes stop_codon:yes gene_type:complete
MNTHIYTSDFHNLAEAYSTVNKQTRVIVERERKRLKSAEEEVITPEEFPIKKVVIYIKQGADEDPVPRYRGTVTDYEEREYVTLIDAIANDRKLVIKIDKNETIDVTVFDGNDNIDNEFSVVGGRLKDPFSPEILQIVKVEEV